MGLFDNDLIQDAFGGGGLTYLLRDEFTTDAAAPLATPMPASHVGGWIITDTQPRFSKAGGKFNIIAATPQAYMFGDTAFAHKAGRAAVFDAIRTGAGIVVGFSSNQTTPTPAARGSLSTNGEYRMMDNRAVNSPISIDTTNKRTLIARRSGGGSWLIQNGVLEWIDAMVSTTALYPLIWATSTAGAGDIDKYFVTDLSGVWTDDYGLSTQRVATTTNGQAITPHSADAWIEHTIVAATGVTQELMVRRTDDNNTLIIRMDQGAGTIKLFSKVAGVETEIAHGGADTQTWTNGTSYRVVVRLQGTSVRVWVVPPTGGSGFNKQNTTTSVNQSVTGVKVSHAGTELAVWMRDVSSLLPAGLTATPS